MTDCFALLDQPRQPALDADALQAKFFALSSLVHPDRVHGAPPAERAAAQTRYTELNAAFQTLREPKDRLRHLVELERGAKLPDLQTIPSGVMEACLAHGELCRRVDAFLAERARAASPLLKAQLFARGLEWTEQVTAAQKQLQSQQNALLAELSSMNDAWRFASPIGATIRVQQLPLARLEEIYRRLSYYTRWITQLQERFVQLSL